MNSTKNITLLFIGLIFSSFLLTTDVFESIDIKVILGALFIIVILLISGSSEHFDSIRKTIKGYSPIFEKHPQLFNINKNSKNNRGKRNFAFAVLTDISTYESVIYFSVSGDQKYDATKEIYRDILNHNSSLLICENGPEKGSPSAFSITERLNYNLEWIAFNNLDDPSHDIIYNKYSNCTERKILHRIHQQFLNNKLALLNKNLTIYTYLEPCLYCYKTLIDVKSHSHEVKFNDVVVFSETLTTENDNARAFKKTIKDQYKLIESRVHNISLNKS